MESWAFYNYSYTQGQAFNVTPSAIGQFHMNWGFIGVLYIGIILGYLTVLADRILLAIDVNRQRAMAVTIGMFYAFIISSFRFYSPVYFAYFLFAFVAMIPLTRDIRKAKVLPARVAASLRHPRLPPVSR